MRRREFIALLAGAATVWPLAVRAQRSTMPVIGYLTAGKPIPALMDEFRRGLVENGYYEGENVVIEYRWAEGQYDRLPALADELVHRRVDVIVTTGGTIAGRVAKVATNTIPIVVLSGADPVTAGLAGSFSHPGGNVTGIAQLVTETDAKRLELLHELVPAADRIAYLANPTLPGSDRVTQNIKAAARALGAKLAVVMASNDADIAAAFTTISQERIGGLLVGADPFFFIQRDQLVALSERNSVPTMYFFREFVTSGGLISYGTRLADGYHQIGVYTGMILKGAKPVDLPIAQQSEKIELIINLKTAKTLGLTVPQILLAGADELIE
jgi:putative tryptophan/tyrosine transport system substrate-binding protein